MDQKMLLEAVAKGVGIETAPTAVTGTRIASDCRPNVRIAFPPDPQGTLDRMVKQDALVLGD